MAKFGLALQFYELKYLNFNFHLIDLRYMINLWTSNYGRNSLI